MMKFGMNRYLATTVVSRFDMWRGDSVAGAFTIWGIRLEGQLEPYEYFVTEEEAMLKYNAMKLKHQASEEVVRIDSTIITVVHHNPDAYRLSLDDRMESE